MALDKSTKALTMTVSGSASATSTANSKFGGSSMSFPGLAGSGIRSNLLTNTAFNIGLRDFTVEYWFNTTDWSTWTTEATQCVMMMGVDGSGSHSNTRLFIYHKANAVGAATTATLNLFIGTGGPSITAPTLGVNVNIANGTWHHVAWVRKNGTLYCYLDGVLAGSGAANISINIATNHFLQIGRYTITNLEFPFKGFIDDFRMTLDVARYPVNIAPPTEPNLTGDIYAANVVAGCAFNGSSGATTATDITGKTVVFGGDAVLSSTQSKSGSVSLMTGAAGVSGTGYVDIGQSSDYVFGTQNFTVEAWIYLTSLPGTPTVAPIMTTLTAGNVGWRFVISNVAGTYSFGFQPGIGGGANVTFVTPPQINTWYHVAATRVGDTLQLFWNGAFMGSAALTAGFSFGQGNTLRIGREHTSASRLVGFVEDVRVTVGAARYVDTGVTSFAAPTSAAPVGFTNYPVIFSTSGAQSSRAGQTVSIQFSATSQASPLVYTRSSGTLPPGLTLSSTGLLSGTIPSGTTPQSYNFTIRAAAGLSSGELSVTYTVVASGNEYVITLIHGDGTLSDTTGRQTLTAGTGATISTAQSKFGGSSIKFDGSNTAASATRAIVMGSGPQADITFGTNDFTVECWAYFNDFGSFNQYPPLVSISDPTTDNIVNSYSWGVRGQNANVANVFWNMRNDGMSGSVNVSLPINTWHHFAFVRQGALQKIFINGAQSYSGTPAGFTASTSYPYITGSILSLGSSFGNSGGGRYSLNGYIDEVRIANGVALYTAAFTPPTAPFNYP